MTISHRNWTLWVMQTARHYGDIASIILETGIEDIDNDHRTMVGQVLEINRLIDSLDLSDFSLELVYQVGELCNRLRDTTKAHFEKEENLLQRYQLHGMSHHAIKHQHIIQQLDDMIADLSEGRLNITLSLKEAILEWVVIHINEEDANIFGPQNVAKTILAHPDCRDIIDIFQGTGIPTLDLIHRQIHFAASLPDFCLDHIAKLKNLLQLSLRMEERLMERYPISQNKDYLHDHQNLLNILEEFSKCRDQEHHLILQQQWVELWIQHHQHHHITQFEVSQWMFKTITKANHPAELDQLFPHLGNEECDQGRLYTYRLVISIVKLFYRLEAFELHGPSILEMKKTLQKLKGHLRFQYELEEELLVQKNDRIKKDHLIEHKHFLSLMDYFGVLIDSSKMALGRATLRKLISMWAAHLLFFDQPDLGISTP